MKAQLDLLRSRDVSSASRGLTWPSQGLGPQIALQVELGGICWSIHWPKVNFGM